MSEMHLNTGVFFRLCILLHELKAKLCGYGLHYLYIPLVYFPCYDVFYVMNVRSNTFMDFNMYKHVLQIPVQQHVE